MKNENSPERKKIDLKEVTDKFWFQYLVMPTGELIAVLILVLIFTPLGKILVQLPVVGGFFETACNVIGASCKTVTISENPNVAQEVKFLCIKASDGRFTTIARLGGRDVQIVKWTSDYFSKAGYNKEKRCLEVSDRFQINYDRGTLKFITHDRVDGQNIICTAPYKDTACIPDGLLFTLKPDENPNEVVSGLLAIKEGGKDLQPLEESRKEYAEFNEILKQNPVSPLF